MLRGVSLVKTFGSRSSASLFSVTSRDHRLEVATFHLHPRNEAAEPATCNEFATTAAKGAYSGWPKGPKSGSSAAPSAAPRQPRYNSVSGRFLMRCPGTRTNVPATVEADR